MKIVDKFSKFLVVLALILTGILIFHFMTNTNDKKLKKIKIELKKAKKTLDSIRVQRTKDASFNKALKDQEAYFQRAQKAQKK